MKTILFCAATLLFSGIAMGQQASATSRQAASAAGTVSQKPGNVQGSGAVNAASSTHVDANAQPVMETSKQAAARTKAEVNHKSEAVVEAAAAQKENAQELTASQVAKTQAVVEASGKTPAIEADKPVIPAAVSVHTDNKTSAAASIDGTENIAVPAMKQKKARVRTNGNVSTSTSVRPGNIQASGLIRTNTGLGL